MRVDYRTAAMTIFLRILLTRIAICIGWKIGLDLTLLELLVDGGHSKRPKKLTNNMSNCRPSQDLRNGTLHACVALTVKDIKIKRSSISKRRNLPLR